MLFLIVLHGNQMVSTCVCVWCSHEYCQHPMQTLFTDVHILVLGASLYFKVCYINKLHIIYIVVIVPNCNYTIVRVDSCIYMQFVHQLLQLHPFMVCHSCVVCRQFTGVCWEWYTGSGVVFIGYTCLDPADRSALSVCLPPPECNAICLMLQFDSRVVWVYPCLIQLLLHLPQTHCLFFAGWEGWSHRETAATLEPYEECKGALLWDMIQVNYLEVMRNAHKSSLP